MLESNLELAANVRRAVMSLEVCKVNGCGVVTADWELCALYDGQVYGPVCHECIRWDEAEGHILRVIDQVNPKSVYDRWAEFMREHNGEE